MTKTAINIGNRLIEAVEKLSEELPPNVMNKDLDLIEEAMDDNDVETLRLFETFLSYNWRPEGVYVPLIEVQRITDELYDHGIENAESLITVERLDAFRAASVKLVRFGYKKWSEASILALVHPGEVPLITALVIDRGIESWNGLNAALVAVKGVEATATKDAA